MHAGSNCMLRWHLVGCLSCCNTGLIKCCSYQRHQILASRKLCVNALSYICAWLSADKTRGERQADDAAAYQEVEP